MHGPLSGLALLPPVARHRGWLTLDAIDKLAEG
jgi:hypothetical protein